MASGYGVLTLGDATALVNQVGQREVFETAREYIADYNAQIQAAARALVERVTEEYTARYYLPGGGQMQRRGGQAQSHAIRGYGYWDVAFPIEEFGDQVAGTRNALAKMSLEKYQTTLDTVLIRNANARRFEMLKAIFNNTARTFPDEEYGSLTIRPLAIVADAVTYPPLQGTTAETTLESYYESGYAASAIADANNPVEFIATKLRQRFGDNDQLVVFFHLDQQAKVEDLTDFYEVDDPNIRAGANDDRLVNVPTDIPGTVIGRANGAWVSIWAQIPTGYAFGMSASQPRPLIERRQPASTGIGYGLDLVTRSADAANYPFDQAHYEDHFGFGVGNRMNGIVLEFGTGGTFTIPTDYA
jgi:hypothetical protein